MEHENFIINSDGELILYYGFFCGSLQIPYGVRKIGKGSIPTLRDMDERHKLVIPPTVNDFEGLELDYVPEFTIYTTHGSPAYYYAKEKGIPLNLI